MGKRTTGRECSIALCKAMGFDPDCVGSIQLDILPTGVEVKVDAFVPTDRIPDVVRVLQQYKLIRKDVDVINEQRVVSAATLGDVVRKIHRVNE